MNKDLVSLHKHYSQLQKRFGDVPLGVQWSDRRTQEYRMRILTEVGVSKTSKVLDFGCGTGHLLTFLRRHLNFTGEYVGYDLSEEMIAAARRKFPKVRFEQRDILTQGIPEDFDYILISGALHNKVSDNWGLMSAVLVSLFTHTCNALAFNVLSTYVDFFDSGVYYYNPEEVFRFCKEQLSPSITLRHDYGLKPGIVPYEFTMYVYKVEEEPRKRRECDSQT